MSMADTNNTGLSVRPLNVSTWPAFADLVERDGGIWGGCWCIGFHLDPSLPKSSGQLRPHRGAKERLVKEGRAHAALVFEGERAVGWSQFGPTSELPNIKHRKEYEKGLGPSDPVLSSPSQIQGPNPGPDLPPQPLPHFPPERKTREGLPDWRITCFYVGKGYRKRGVANLALAGALSEIARLGGGLVEAYPENVEGRKTSSSFLYGGTLKMFEREGFTRDRPLGMYHWVVRKMVAQGPTDLAAGP